jgi:peptidoglycan/LPS O-acetylase OafA/YrhL
MIPNAGHVKHGKNARIEMKDHGGLRGLAAVWVVIFHCMYYSTYPIDLLGSTLMPLFFLLSGFSLTIGYYKRLIPKPHEYKAVEVVESNPSSPADSETSHKSQLFNPTPASEMSFATFQYYRFLRVMPVYFILLAISIAPNVSGYGPIDPRSKFSLIASAILNIIPINTWLFFLLGYGQPYIGPLWTICTLWFFWICFPSLLRSYDKKTDEQLLQSIVIMYIVQIIVGIVLLGIVGAILPPAAFAISTMWPPSRLPVFIMGMSAALLVLRHPGQTLPWFKSGKWFFSSTLCGGVCCEPFPVLTSEDFSTICVWQVAQLLLISAVTLIIDTIVRYALGGGGIFGAFWLQLLNPFSQICIIVALTRLESLTNTVTAVLRHPILQYLGELSMSLYMVHMLVYYFLRWAVSGQRTLAWPSEFDCTKYDDDVEQSECEAELQTFYYETTLPPWNVIVVLPVSLLFSMALYYLVEEPIRNKFRG